MSCGSGQETAAALPTGFIYIHDENLFGSIAPRDSTPDSVSLSAEAAGCMKVPLKGTPLPSVLGFGFTALF
ncbi:protein of unknown function [Streptomyces murinus]